MMKIIKNFIQYDADGYSGERKFYKEKSTSIQLEIKAETSLIPFAMDTEKQNFIIFMIPRKNDVNMYLWVYLRKEISDNYHRKQICITPVNELMLFTKWSGEPMDVSGNYPEEIVDIAISLLQSWQDKDILEGIHEFSRRLNEAGGYEYWKKEERDLLHTVAKAKKENNGMMYMY